MKNRHGEEEAARLQASLEEMQYVFVDESSDDQSLLEDEGFLVLDVPRNEPSSPSNGQENPQLSSRSDFLHIMAMENEEFLERKKLMELEQHLKNVTDRAESLTKYVQAIREKMGVKLSESETEEAILKSRRIRAADMSNTATAADKAGRLCTEMNSLSLKSQIEKFKSGQRKIKIIGRRSISEAHQQIKADSMQRR